MTIFENLQPHIQEKGRVQTTNERKNFHARNYLSQIVSIHYFKKQHISITLLNKNHFILTKEELSEAATGGVL